MKISTQKKRFVKTGRSVLISTTWLFSEFCKKFSTVSRFSESLEPITLLYIPLFIVINRIDNLSVRGQATLIEWQFAFSKNDLFQNYNISEFTTQATFNIIKGSDAITADARGLVGTGEDTQR